MFLSTEFSSSQLDMIKLYRQNKISVLQLGNEIGNSKLELVKNKEDVKNVK